MTARPSRTQLLRQAKLVADDLRSALSSGQDPADSSTEFLRQSLRRNYTSFLFASATPSVRASDVVNLLWLECSHAIITRHRERITRFDAEVAKQRPQSGGSGRNRGPHNPAARRKLVHTLRAFLTAEETFWASLIARLIETFHVDRARSAARTLGLSVAPHPDVVAPISAEAAANALALVQSAFIFYGDLQRYLELCKETPAGSQRRYERAAECYHQARLLAPSNGRADNQLAVIASARKDLLSAAFHYMRAIAVRSSFETARSNLESTFKQAMLNERSAEPVDVEDPTSLGDATSRAFVASLALLVSPSRKEGLLPFDEQFERTKSMLSSALAARALSSESIIKILLLAIGIWWDVRLGAERAPPSRKVDERAVLEVVLEILVACLDVATSMTEQSLDASLAAAKADVGDIGFSSRISAPVRRIAPALRIASVWLLGHLDSVNRASNRDTFWAAYVRTVNMFVTAFPPEMLPTLPPGANLEEDFELLAFLPCPLPSNEATTAYIADHPNSEFLLRVHGFVSDATLVAGQLTHLPILNGLLVDRLPTLPTALDVAVADAAEDDDVVSEAMRAARLTPHALDEGEEEEEDEDILYMPRSAADVVMPPIVSSVGGSAHVSPAPTAGDLLLSMLSGGHEGVAPNIWAPTPTRNGGDNDPWRLGNRG